MNWHPHKSCFDGRMFTSVEAMPDEVLSYNLMAAKFCFGLPSSDKDILLDVANVWKRDAKRRKLHVGPRRVVPMFDKVDGKEVFVGVAFECPACGTPHAVTTTKANPSGAKWEWNGSYDRPTISPSIRVLQQSGETICHLFVREGKAEFCGDCAHLSLIHI